MKSNSKHNIILIGSLIICFLGVIDCSSKISLVYNRLPKMDSPSNYGTLEVSLENIERSTVKSIYIWYLALFNNEIIEVAANKATNIQTHEGDLYADIPYQINLPPGEYYARLEALDVPAKNHDLVFPFSVFFGYYLDIRKEPKIAIASNYMNSKCSFDDKFLNQCSKIIIKKNLISKIIIRVQKEVPVKSELGIQAAGPRRIPLPHVINIQESPEVLIEVQNPK